MESDNSSSSDDVPLFDDATKVLYSVQLWMFILLIIPSIFFTLFDLYYFLFDRALRQALNNHVIIFLLTLNLVCALTDIPMYIHYFRTYESFTLSSVFYLAWGYADWTFFVIFFMLFAWTTIERHIFIFHSQLFATRKKRIFLHYLPPFIITAYCCLYYIVIFFVIQCQNNFENLNQPGFYPCAFENSRLAMYDIIAHSILPTLTIVISSFALLCRVLWQRYHIRGQIHWTQHRKLTIQVLSISFVYLILSFPYLFVQFLNVCGMPADIGAKFVRYAVYGVYYTMLLFPMIAAGSIPGFRKQMIKLLHCQHQQRRVVPIATAGLQMTNNRINIRSAM